MSHCQRGGAVLCAAVVGLALLLTTLLLADAPQQPPQPPPPRLERRLPQAIVIGARKCGTRALLDFLRLHPRVRAAPEEVHYFDRAERLSRGLGWYRSRMPLSGPGDLTLEKTPAYFVTASAPDRVRHMSTSVRLLLVLRDPVRRVVSDYAQHLHRRRTVGKRPQSLEALVLRRDGSRVNPRARMVLTSVYHRHLRRWLARFGRAQVHLVDGDLLARRPASELQRAEQFLGLPAHIRRDHFVFNATKGFYCATVGAAGGSGQRCLGAEKGRQHPPVSADTLAKLRRFFARHDEQLAQLTGRRFDWMRRRSRDSTGY